MYLPYSHGFRAILASSRYFSAHSYNRAMRPFAAGIACLVFLVGVACGRGGPAPVSSPAVSTADHGSSATVRASPSRSSRPARARATPQVRPIRTAGCEATFAAGNSIGQIESGGELRSYRLHVPPTYISRRATPLVLSFHGYAQDAAQQDAYSLLPAFSDQAGFILVTPEGSGSPAGWDIPGVYNENGIDDVAFVNQLVSDLSNTLCLDARRIFATGHSNGAQMASQVACDLPWLIAAAAPVSGAVFQDCTGAGVPMIAFQGDADYNVPLEESEEGVLGWVSHNACPTDPEISRPAEGVELRSWNCSDGDVQFYVMEDVGHVWPGGDPLMGGVGPATDVINANQLMWEFFRAHPHR